MEKLRHLEGRELLDITRHVKAGLARAHGIACDSNEVKVTRDETSAVASALKITYLFISMQCENDAGDLAEESGGVLEKTRK